jgi:hypothetical protein
MFKQIGEDWDGGDVRFKPLVFSPEFDIVP